MLLPRLRTPFVGATQCLASLETALSSLRISQCQHTPLKAVTAIRHSTSLSQGRANGAKDGPGKRLGAKKSGEQYVIPGNIIFRQRGTHWFPGDNCAMGRDHTIYATQPGYVKYYRDPARHPKRQFIGVVFERSQTLPQPANAVRRRRLGMLAWQMTPLQQGRVMEVEGEEEGGVAEDTTGDGVTGQETGLPGNAGVGQGLPSTIRETPREERGLRIVKVGKEEVKKTLTLRPGYQYRMANWEIGRAAERAAKEVRPFKPRDRFLAWRKTTARKARNAERRGMRSGGKKK